MNQENKHKQAIGVFDSGIGGLTVANAIIKLLPNEEIIYFGDTAHLPYGDKSADAIRYYCLKIVKFLLERKCKMIVIACNSASTAAYNILLDFYEGQAIFVNVVDPLVNKVSTEGYEKIGVIATKATIRSNIYKQKLIEQSPHQEVVSMATPLLVPMIEEGFFHNNISKVIIQNYLGDPVFEKIQALLLACTHYPLIKSNIEQFFEQKVDVFDSTDVVAEAVKQKLEKHDLLNDERRGEHQFYLSDYTHSFEQTAQLFYGAEAKLEHFPLW